MAVLQYVGARYVPVFYKNPNGSWEWEPGVSYEALTIVKYGMSTYISRSPVPASAGAPNVSLDYWAETGNYNGTVAELSARVSRLERRVRKRYVFIGDSFNTGYPSYRVTPWPNLLAQQHGLETSDWYNFATPAGGLVTVGNNGTYQGVFDSNKLSIIEPDSISDVVVTFAYNDLGKSGIFTAWQSLYNDIRESLPNAVIHVGFIGALSRLDSRQVSELAQYMNEIVQNNSGAKILDNLQYLFIYNGSSILDSSNHPTQTGHTMLAGAIYAAIDGGYSVTYPNIALKMGAKNIGTLSTTNDVTTISIGNFSLTIADAISFQKGVLQEIATISSDLGNLLFRENGIQYDYPATISFRGVLYTGYLRIGSGKIMACLSEDVNVTAGSTCNIFMSSFNAAPTLYI